MTLREKLTQKFYEQTQSVDNDARWITDRDRADAALSTLRQWMEDEGTVLAVTIAIAITSDVSPEKTEDYEAGETTNMYDVARAVLRTLAARAQGESS